MIEERNFAELAGELTSDNFRERHEAGLWVGRHGEAALEGPHAVSSADPSAEDECVTAVEGDGWLEVDRSRRVRHVISGEILYLARQLSAFWTDNLLRGVPEVDERGLAEIGNSKEETHGTQFRQVRAARCVIPYVLYAA
jgi:hypothetical protein